MILVVNVCFEKLHYYEFVKSIEDVLKKDNIKFFTKHYLDLSEDDLDKCDKIIICGTSLKDSDYLENMDKFNWLKSFEKPVLGICAGFQILGLIFGGKLGKKVEVGFFRENFSEEFLGLKGEVEVYHLHNNYVEFGEDWKVYSGERIVQAVNYKNFYGVLFHPEVRNKEMILEFCK